MQLPLQTPMRTRMRPRMLDAVLLVVMVVMSRLSCSVAGSGISNDDDISCKRSGMCSAGEVKYFHGSIMTSDGFKSAMEATTYNRELIIVTTAGSKYLEFVFQLHNQFYRLGIAHFMALSFSEDGCQELDNVGKGIRNVSCAWDESPMHPRSWGGGPRLWHLRWRFLARAARLRYNVLSLDSDYMIFQEPYLFLKSPPLSKASLLAVAEHGCGMNGGFAYIQNTRPDGPVAWLFHHTTEVPLRWMDDDYKHTESWGVQEKGKGVQCMTFDQSFLDDSLHSTLAGLQIFKAALVSCTRPEWKGPDGSSREDVLTRQTDLVACHQHLKSVECPTPSTFPPEPSLPANAKVFDTFGLKVPNPPEPLDPLELGGALYSRIGGNYTDLYFNQLEGDCPSTYCPWWKDDSRDDSAAVSTTETFAFVPKWLANSACFVNHGYLTPPDGSHPRQIMVHIHAMGFARDHWKTSALKVYGVFDYNLSRALHSHPEHHHKMEPGPYMCGRIPDKVIAMSPYVDLSRTKDLVEFKRISAGLVQLGVISGRTVVFPDFPCRTPWAHQNNKSIQGCNSTTRLLSLHMENLPYAARDEPHSMDNVNKSFRIFSAFLSDRGCLGPMSMQQGLINVEFEEWLQHDLVTGKPKGPTPSNTLFFKERAESAGQDGGNIGDATLRVNPDEVAAELERLKDESVVYLGHPVVVDMTEEEALGRTSKYMNWCQQFLKVLQECRALHYTPFQMNDQGAAKVAQYVFGPMASIQDGKLVPQ